MIGTQSEKEVSEDDSPRWRGCLAGFGLAAATAVLAMTLGPPAAVVGAATGLGPLKAIRCAPMASDPALEAPLYAQQTGASPKSDGWWCQLPHATQIPSGLVPLRRDAAPLPNNYGLEETVYSTAGTARDVSISSNGRRPAVIVEVKLNSAVTPGPTAHMPQFTSTRQVGLGKGVTGYLLTSGNQTDVSWAFPTTGVPKYLSGVASVTVAGYAMPASTVIAIAKHVKPL